MSSRITYDSALTKYYDLKHKYEENIKKNRRKGVTDKKCIACKKRGGTLFSNQNGILSAVCKADRQCGLNITIQKAITYNIQDLLHIANNDKNSEETNILKLKLNYLFGFIDEDELTNEFDELKDNYNETLGSIKSFDEVLEEQTNKEERLHEVRINNIKKNRRIANVKNLVKEFLATDNDALLDDITRLNVKIHRNEGLAREEMYMVNNIETFKDPETKVGMLQLHQVIDSIESKEFTQPGKVIQFTLK